LPWVACARAVSSTALLPKRPPLAALLYGLLLAGMAVGQLASLDAFEDALASYELPGGLQTAAVIGLPALEVLAAVGLLGAGVLPRRAAQAAAGLGLVVAVAWTLLAVQAFARGLEVENCGCFGAYLAQELRWWVLLEDGYMLLLALWAAVSVDVRLPVPGRRPGPSVAAALAVAALIVPAAGAAATERCCFLVDARVSGRLSLTTGPELATPGASVYRARWAWRVRHVVRYLEHGRIFNALTRVGQRQPAELSIRLAEERVGLRPSACRHTVARDVVDASERAYVSLEDTIGGKIALIVSAEHPALRSRCGPGVMIPTAHVLPAPAGVALRQSRALSLAWDAPIRLHDGAAVGSVEVRVGLRILPARASRR
jgi:Methylamine utilisation protein MauE